MSEDLLDERRNSKRRHLIYYLKMYDIDGDRLFGNLLDININGLMLVSETPVETDKDYHLKLVFPKPVLAKEEVALNARCLWCQQDVNPDLFAAGFQITQITEEDQAVIKSLVHKHGFQD